jgi:hypothetical protein
VPGARRGSSTKCYSYSSSVISIIPLPPTENSGLPAIVPSSFPGPSPFFSVDAPTKKTDACFCAPCHLGLLLSQNGANIVPASSFPGPSRFFSVDANKKTDACSALHAIWVCCYSENGVPDIVTVIQVLVRFFFLLTNKENGCPFSALPIWFAATRRDKLPDIVPSFSVTRGLHS